MTRRTRKAALAAALAIPILAAGAGITAANATSPGRQPERPTATPAAPDIPSHLARVTIPEDSLGWYRQWNSQCPGLSWSVVAAIGQVTTNHGRLGTAVRSGTNPDGTAGPMQLGVGGDAGDTWVDFGLDGDGDGRADVYNPADAIRGAYAFLCDLGADQPGRLQEALHAYVGSEEDVQEILHVAQQYRETVADGLDPATVALLDNPSVELSFHARADLADRVADPRISRLLNTLAERYTLKVGLVQGAHPERIPGTQIPSSHTAGLAVDLTHVNGQPVNTDNAAARELVASLNELSEELRPEEIDSPFTTFNTSGDGGSHRDHTDSIHLGYPAV